MKRVGIIIAIIAMAIGFASVSATLIINGSAKINPDNDSFKENIKFISANIDEASILAGAKQPEISKDGKTLTFETKEFNEVGDKTLLTYKIKNESDTKAKFQTPAVVCSPTTESSVDYNTYLTLTTGDKLNDKTLDSNESKEDTLEVLLKKTYVGNGEKVITYTCTIDVEAVE